MKLRDIIDVVEEDQEIIVETETLGIYAELKGCKLDFKKSDREIESIRTSGGSGYLVIRLKD